MADHGPDAVALYVSGQFLTEDYYVANKLIKGFIGSANIDTNSRLCMASSVAGHVRAFGEDIVPGCYDDIEAADLVILVGSNTAWCHPVVYQRLVAAREKRGTKVVAIDPRHTATCDIADIHLAIRSGTDVAVFAGLLVHLAASGVCDKAWTEEFASDFAAATEAARKSAPSVADAAEIADVPATDLARFYDWFARTERTVTLYSQGTNQSSSGTDKVNAIINCHLATGRLGRPGMGPFSLTGQPNAMGGREVGGLANQLAAHMSFADPADVDRVSRFWNASRMATRPGLKAVDLFDAALDGKIKALWILNTNPAASMPRAQRVRSALGACRLSSSATAGRPIRRALPTCVLPAAAWGEKDGTVTNSERCISRQRAFRPPPGEARPDWWMLTEVARRMGSRKAFAFRSPAEIFREHAALSAFENEQPWRRIFNIGALSEISDEDYDRMPPICWPLPRGTPEPWPSAKRLFGDGKGFTTPDGRARFVPTPYRPPAVLADDQWPFVLNTGRVRDQWHTMTRTGRLPRLMAHQCEPVLDIHPADAGRLHFSNGGLARIESPHGASTMPVRLSSDLRQGEVFAPIHWTDQFTSAGPIDAIVGAATDPVSGQPELKATPGPCHCGNVAMAWPTTSRLRTGPARSLLLGAHPDRTGTRIHAHRLGAVAERPRHRVMDCGAARCAASGGTGDLCRPRPWHVPLCQRGRTASGRLPVHCRKAVCASFARHFGSGVWRAYRAQYALLRPRRRRRPRRAKCSRPHNLRLLWRRLEYSAQCDCKVGD